MVLNLLCIFFAIVAAVLVVHNLIRVYKNWKQGGPSATPGIPTVLGAPAMLVLFRGNSLPWILLAVLAVDFGSWALMAYLCKRRFGPTKRH